VRQEHGLLDPPADMADNHARVLLKEWAEELLGTMLHVRPQHACLTCAGHPWYYIVDSDEAEGTEILVRDLWVPWKGW
jgi:D-serine deaminase-like pyridoxal phosphate-dependent protein